MAATAAEARRIVKRGRAAGIMIQPNFNGLALDHPYFDPLYEVARDLNVPVCVHASVGSHRNVQGYGIHENWFMTHSLAFPFGIIHAVASVVCGGVLERFPGLRVGFFEGGCGWLPFFMERFDEHYEKIGQLVPHLKRRPSETSGASSSSSPASQRSRWPRSSPLPARDGWSTRSGLLALGFRVPEIRAQDQRASRADRRTEAARAARQCDRPLRAENPVTV